MFSTGLRKLTRKKANTWLPNAFTSEYQNIADAHLCCNIWERCIWNRDFIRRHYHTWKPPPESRLRLIHAGGQLPEDKVQPRIRGSTKRSPTSDRKPGIRAPRGSAGDSERQRLSNLTTKRAVSVLSPARPSRAFSFMSLLLWDVKSPAREKELHSNRKSRRRGRELSMWSLQSRKKRHQTDVERSAWSIFWLFH